jgi:hypothetical protein
MTDWLCELTDWLCEMTHWLCGMTDWLCELTDWLCEKVVDLFAGMDEVHTLVKYERSDDLKGPAQSFGRMGEQMVRTMFVETVL